MKETSFPGSEFFTDAHIRVLKGYDVFAREEYFKQRFLLHENPALGNPDRYYVAKLAARKLGISRMEDDLVSTIKGKGAVKIQTYTKAGVNGRTILDLDNPEEMRVDLPQNGFDVMNNGDIFLKAYDNDVNTLKKLVGGMDFDKEHTTVFGAEKLIAGITEEVDEAWREVSPAFLYLAGSGNSGRGPDYGSTKRLDLAHQEFLNKYALSYYIHTKEIADSDVLLEHLYLNSHWLVNVPGIPGGKRLIDKNLPLPFASDLESSDIEYFLDLWNKHAKPFEDYIRQRIGIDTDSNILVYADMSTNGAGISFFYKLETATDGKEDPSTFIPWEEFGDWISMKYKYRILSDIDDWFKKKESFEHFGLKAGKALGWFGLDRREKMIDLLRKFEVGASSGKVSMYNYADNSFYDDASFWNLYLNKLGGSEGQPNPNEDDFADLRNTWFLSPILRGTAQLSGLTRGAFTDEYNWARSFFGNPEIGYLEREAMIDFLKALKKEYPDPNDLTPEKFDDVLNEEMSKYVLTEQDWWDSLSDGASTFAKWAKQTAKTIAPPAKSITPKSKRRSNY